MTGAWVILFAVLLLGWGSLTLYTFRGIFRGLAAWQCWTALKMIAGMLIVGAWAAAQIFSYLLVVVLSYCETCSGKPPGLHDLFMCVIILGPSALALGLLQLARWYGSAADRHPG